MATVTAPASRHVRTAPARGAAKVGSVVLDEDAVDLADGAGGHQVGEQTPLGALDVKLH